MGRDGIPTKGIQHQEVKVLRCLLGKREPRIARHQRNRGRAPGEICKVGLGYVDHLWVDLIEPDRVPCPAVCGHRAGPAPDHAYASPWPVSQRPAGVPDATATAI